MDFRIITKATSVATFFIEKVNIFYLNMQGPIETQKGEKYE